MRSSIVLAAAALLCLAGTAAANPIMVVMYSEVRVAPDSLEAIELYPYENVHCPVDLSGLRIVTRAGTATIDSGVVLEETSFVVIDRSNTTGTFSLGDSCDSIVILEQSGWPIEGGTLQYPGYYSEGPAFVPQPGQSAALFQRYVNRWPDPYFDYRWYIDSTPTFGSGNDDTLGRISGRVLDDRGLPVYGAWVTMRNRHGRDYTYTDSSGRYSIFPVGPGVYELSAGKTGHLPGVFPDSVRPGVNQQVDTVDIWLYRVGVEEVRAWSPVWYTGRLFIDAASAGLADVRIYDATGREALRRSTELKPGRNWLSLDPSLRSGSYFVRVRTARHTYNSKITLAR
ncbi:MAG: carboxypeptidase regulatory-like domain-containing protein [bacterium]